MRPQHVAPPEPLRGAGSGDAFPGGLFEMTLAGGPHAAAIVRAAVAGWMTGHVDETTVVDTQLLLGELVANCARHADTRDDDVVHVRVGIRGDTLRVDVQDGGSTGSIALRPPDLQHGGGFGLNVVDALSRRWGVARDAGTRVWAEIGIRTPRVDGGENDPEAA
jgi:anti-sigma regulatory factor (Ser/Thr protein kinase)